MPTRRKNDTLRSLFFDDFVETRLQKDYLHELRDLYHFYLSDNDRAELAKMGRFKRALVLLGWTLKNMLTRLSPPRRLLLLVALVLAITRRWEMQWGASLISIDLSLLAFLIAFVVLMLELKDKLVARDEIEIARQVQLALLPNVHPELPGWGVWSYSRPAREVGGDLVDYLELDGFRHGILIGDVAGKGLGAAMLSAKLQATFRALVTDADALDELGQRVNAIFANDGIKNRYATLFYAELEYHSGSLRYINAGHNPSYLVQEDGIKELKSSSFPIGMFDRANYEEESLVMQPGDLLVAYSDGLTEATNEAGDEYGEERLEKLLLNLRHERSEAIGRRVLSDVDRFLGDARNHDDLSLVVLAKHE